MTFPRRLRVLGPVTAALLVVPAAASCAAPAPAPAATTPAPSASAGPESRSAAEIPTGSAPFTFDLPTGWEEQEPASGLPTGVQFERLAVGSTNAGFKTNITVVSQEAPPGATLQDAADQTIDAARSAGHTILVEPEPADGFDGVEGLRYSWEMPGPTGDQVVHQDQVALSRDGRFYFVSLSADRSDPDLGTAMDAVRNSWKWS